MTQPSATRLPCALLSGLLLLAAASLPAPLRAQPSAASEQAPAAPEATDDPGEAPGAASIAQAFPNPDPGGFRAWFEERGVTYGLTYIAETLGNVSGGTRRGSVFQGRLDMELSIDLEKLAGLPGLTFHANAFQIHGRGLSECCLGNLATVSGIEAQASSRLYELWLEQALWDDRVALRLGQLAVDTEFFTSQYAGLFVNATFGWPAVMGANLPAGGPAYPLAALFDGDPAGPGEDPQRSNRSGTRFRTRDPGLAIAELNLGFTLGSGAAGLPGMVKLGGYHHFGGFDDLRRDVNGLSLRDPASSGVPRRIRGNSGIYASLDQLAYREPGTRDQGLGVFLRVAGSPSATSQIDFYADGGVTYKGLLPGRVNDTLGLGLAYAHVSSAARGLDRDQGLFGPVPQPVRSSEAVAEVSYQGEVVPGLTVQPFLQYILRPGGHVANPRDPGGAAIRNATVLGLRAALRY